MTKQYDRKRMLEVRSEVKQYLLGNNPKKFNNLSDMPQSMSDAKRVIIALQDRLEREVKAHHKATNIVRKQGENLSESNIIIGLQHMQILEAQNDTTIQMTLNNAHTDECTRLSEGWNEASKKVLRLNLHNSDLQEKLDAAMQTLHTSMESMYG